MNSFVNVQVRILAAQASAQLAALQNQVNGLGGSFGRARKGANMFGTSLDGMRLDAFGSRVQWIGRQLEYNFTLPVLAAAAASFKLALDNEAAFTRVEKVYGDAGHGAQEYGAEIQALQRNFVALSNAYGINQQETITIAAQWAAAGASGVALAKSVDLTMQTMILGEMKAAEATEALIAIQAQYGQNVGELTKTIAILNMVENQTGISLNGLVQGFARAAGIARDAGVDVRHLAAMLASLTPAAGSAAQAGNAIKTILSRLVAPTKETGEVLGLMGINISSMAWKSADATTKLTLLSESFQKLDRAQQNVVSSVVASRWQVNKFSVLMRDLTNVNGYYQKALRGTNSELAVFNQMQKELNKVLNSNPRRLQIIWTMLQNAAADIIQPMIPLLLYLATAIQRMVTWFSNLNPAVQKLIMVLLLLLAVIGPLIRLGGALILLVSQLGMVFGLLLAPIGAVSKAFYTLLKVPVAGFFSALSFLVRYGIAILMMMIPGVVSVFKALDAAMIAGARMAGIVWRAGFGLITTVTMGVWAAVAAITTRFLVVLEGIIAVGMAFLGKAWRAGLAVLAAIQKIWAALMLINWRWLFANMIALAMFGFAKLRALFIAFIPAIRAFSFAAMAALTGPWGLAITLVIALIVAFWDELKSAWRVIVQGTINAFNSLPAGVRNAFMAVVNIVRAAVMAVYEMLQWMNPWARHSPSLVDNVTTGVAEIQKQYSALDAIGDIFRKAGLSLQSFGRIVQNLKRIAQLQEITNQRKDLEEFASSSIPMFNKLVSVLFPLQDLLGKIGAQVAAQQAKVDGWTTRLDAANAALEAQEKILNRLQDVANGYQDQLTAAQSEMDRFASAPIEGMKAMEDAIFANQMRQKELRLEMMNLEDAIGPLDELRSRVDLLNGQMELLSGEQANLRNAGAGSEILDQYDAQIDMLEQQKQAIDEQIRPIQDLTDQIEDLGREAERLDLENALKFDPLKKQIDDLVNSMDEMPFEEILAGVTANRAEVDRLTEAYNRANDAVIAQQAIVDQMTAARDAIQASYDAEAVKLQQLQDEYSLVEAKVRDIESALQDMGSAARAAGEAANAAGGGRGMSPGAENFKGAAGGNFPDPGGFAQIGREGGMADQSKLIDEFTKEMADKTKNMFGAFDFLEPIKKGWNTAWGWVKANIGGPIGEVGSRIKSAIGGMSPFDDMDSWLDTVKDVGNSIKDAFKLIWDVIGPEVIKLGKEAWAGLQDAFKDIQPEIEKFRDLVGPMGEALGNLWTILKPVLAIVLGLILAVIKALIGGLAGAIGPVIRGIGDLIAGIIKVIRGIIEFIVGVFTGDWEMALNGLKDIASGIWQAIAGVFKNAVAAIWGFIKGLVMGIVDFFVWLYDELVGHSVIPDMINAILDWFRSLDDKAKALFKALVDGIKAVWDWLWEQVSKRITAAKENLTAILNAIKSAATTAWNALTNALKAAWDWVWDQIKSKIDTAKNLINTAVNAIKNIFTGLSTAWTSVVNSVKGLIDKFVSNFNAIKNRFSFSGMFNGITGAFKSAINWVISKWNNFSFPALSVGGVQLSPSIGTPNIPLLAKGGMIAKNAMAVIGEGRKGFPEYVIPTDPLHRRRALALFNRLGGELGGGKASKKMVYAPAHAEARTYHFHGNLEFPNIKSGEDAEEFIRNLEALINEV